MTDRIARLTQQLETLGVDAFWVTDEVNVRYLTGFTGDSSSLLVQRDGGTIFSDGRYKTQLEEECPGLAYQIKAPAETPTEFLSRAFGDCLASLSVPRIAIEADQVTLARMREFSQAIESVNWVETTGVVAQQRMIKDADEIKILRDSVRINERALNSVLAKLGPDWTEQEVAFELEATIRRLGATGFSFEPIIGAGPGGAKPHYRSGKVPLGDHPTLLIDWGTELQGYASDLTRCFHFGDPPARFLSAYEAVLEAQLAAIDAIRPGVEGSKVDAAARSVLKKANLDQYFVHGLGHGVGLFIHENPRLSAVSTDILQPGMVITVEPGVYFEGQFGIRIEDDVLVTETGHEVISVMPKGLEDCRVML